MKPFHWQLIETAVIITSFFIVKYVSKKAIMRTIAKVEYHPSRVMIVKKIINILITLIAANMLLIVWGVNQSSLMLFISSFLTVLGVAFFAQWSILSNVTATLILFFNHRAKIGDTISVAESETLIAGEISDITLFFVIITTTSGEEIMIPSNVFIQKAIKKAEKK